MKKLNFGKISTITAVALCIILLVFAGCASSTTTSPATSSTTVAISSPTSSVTGTTTQTTANQQNIEIISVKESTSQPVNPGGPVIEIVVKDVGQAVTGLAITLDESASFSASSPLSYKYNFSFTIIPGHPLYPGETAGSSATLINGAWGDGIKYTLMISGTLDSGEVFSYTWEPPSGGDYSSGTP